MLLYFIKPFLKIGPEFFFHFPGKFLCIRFSIFKQMLYVHFTWIRMLAYYLIQMWLCKFRIVAFIMAVPAIANHINKNIGIKFLAIKSGYLSTFYHCLGIITIYMQHRCLDCGSK